VSSDVNSAFWIAFICVVFMLPFAYVGVPWNKGFDWDFFNYTILTVGATFLLFGGWYVLSAASGSRGRSGREPTKSSNGSSARSARAALPPLAPATP
jgi:hypothetical protein